MGSRANHGEPGYAMVALLVGLSVMAIALSAALPVFQTVARREREAELVFRGEQYARAIGLFQRKYANALPPTVDALLAERFLRKKYKDPITGEDFRLLGPPELVEALSAPPGAQQFLEGADVRFTSQTGRGRVEFATGRGASQPVGEAATLTRVASDMAGARAGGGILAVASSSTQASLKLYNGKGRYNEWVFMALQASTAAGAPSGTGAQEPGARGGAPRGRVGGLPSGLRGRGSGRSARGGISMPSPSR